MPLQNRVMPTGAIVVHPARGLFMGNRGCLHDGDRRLVRQRSSQRFWITCVTTFKDRRRTPMTPGRYTELFFLDEAVAFAAGHRPCAECRRADYDRFRAAWVGAFGGERPSAPEMDARLGADRRDGEGRQVTFQARAGDLPDGTFVDADGGSCLVAARALRPFDPTGYGSPRPLDPERILTVLTPRTTVAVLEAGYEPVLHPSAAPGPI